MSFSDVFCCLGKVVQICWTSDIVSGTWNSDIFLAVWAPSMAKLLARLWGPFWHCFISAKEIHESRNADIFSPFRLQIGQSFWQKLRSWDLRDRSAKYWHFLTNSAPTLTVHFQPSLKTLKPTSFPRFCYQFDFLPPWKVRKFLLLSKYLDHTWKVLSYWPRLWQQIQPHFSFTSWTKFFPTFVWQSLGLKFCVTSWQNSDIFSLFVLQIWRKYGLWIC